MTDIDISVGLPPTFESTQYIATAEKLGYRRAYPFDTPFEGDDVWLGLHRAAELTATIELGPGVLIPTQRHPLVNAAQTVSLDRMAPGASLPRSAPDSPVGPQSASRRYGGPTWKNTSAPTGRCWPARRWTGRTHPSK